MDLLGGRTRYANPEQSIKKAICHYLAYHPRVFFWCQDSTGTYDPTTRRMRRKVGFARNGVPDILGHVLIDGVPVALYLEVKSTKGRQSDSQKKFEYDAQVMGGYYFVVRSVQETISALECLEAEVRQKKSPAL